MVQRGGVCARLAGRRARAAGAGFVGDLFGNSALFHSTGWREPDRRRKRGVPRAAWRRNGSSRFLRSRFRTATAKLAGTMEARGNRFDGRSRARLNGNGTALDAAGGWRASENVLRVERAAAESFCLAAGRLGASSAQPLGCVRLGTGLAVLMRHGVIHCGPYEKSQADQRSDAFDVAVLRDKRRKIPAEGF